MDSASKLRIKLCDVEIECEGSEVFLKEELPQLLRSAIDLCKIAPNASANRVRSAEARSITDGHELPQMTTATIAAKIKVNSGPDLIRAAAARLNLIDQKATFSRQELLREMQTATGYYKKSYSKNLSRYLTGALSDGILTESAANTFALGATVRTELERQLANA